MNEVAGDESESLIRNEKKREKWSTGKHQITS